MDGAPARAEDPATAPSAVIFDNDGLLLDTESVWTRAERKLYERRGHEFTLAHKQELVGQPADAAATIMALHLDESGPARELISELDQVVFEELESGVEPMAGARELVAAVRARRIPIALVSNSPARFIARALELVGMEDQFPVVVSGHEVPAPKPAPDAYLRACELLGVAADREVIVLEDSPTGVTAALAAGLTTIGIPSLPGIGLDHAHQVVGSLRAPELLELLELVAE